MVEESECLVNKKAALSDYIILHDGSQQEIRLYLYIHNLQLQSRANRDNDIPAGTADP